MATLGSSASSQSLFDFFEDKPKRRKSSDNHPIMVDNVKKSDVPFSPEEDSVSDGQDVVYVSDLQKQSSEHEMEKEKLQQSDTESERSKSSESISLYKDDSESHYSEDFNSCPSISQDEDYVENTEHIERDDENEDTKMIKYEGLSEESDETKTEILCEEFISPVKTEIPCEEIISQVKTVIPSEEVISLMKTEIPCEGVISQVKTEIPHEEVIAPAKTAIVGVKGEGESNNYGFVEEVHVTTKEGHVTTKEENELKTKLKKSGRKTNTDIKKQTPIRNVKSVKDRKSFNGTEKEMKCKWRESNFKSVLLCGKTQPSMNNNSKANPKRKYFCKKNISTETSGAESEGMMGILKIDSDTKDEFASNSDQLLMGSSSSGYSFVSRYSMSSLQNSPYNSNRYSNGSKYNHLTKGRLSLPSINKTIPGQLVRGGKGSLKRSSDSDVSRSSSSRKKSVRKSEKTKMTEAKSCKATVQGRNVHWPKRPTFVQKIGDYGKPKIPIQLKAEAILRDGQLEVSVTDREDVEIGTKNLNVKLTVVHRFVDQKSKHVTSSQQRPTEKRQNWEIDRDVINQRAMWPSFNTYTDTEASERYYNRFKK